MSGKPASKLPKEERDDEERDDDEEDDVRGVACARAALQL